MNRSIKRFNFAILLFLAAALVTGCAKKAEKEQVVAQINNYQLTVDDFMQEARLNLPSMLLKDTTGATKEGLYKDIVTNELILQQAEKMDLDKDPAFMKEIENYWKQTLIKRLIKIKGEEFMAMAKGPNEAVKKKRAQELLNLWVENLKKTAKIHRYDDVLNKIDLNTIKISEGGQDAE